LDTIEYYIQNRLLHKIHINSDWNRIGRKLANQFNTVLFRIGSSQQRNLIEHQTQIDFFQVQVPWTREVHEDLDYAIEAMNFAVNNIHVTIGVWINFLQFVAQQLQVKNDGIDWVLYLVSDAARDPAAGGNPAREFDFVFNAAGRFSVPHG